MYSRCPSHLLVFVSRPFFFPYQIQQRTSIPTQLLNRRGGFQKSVNLPTSFSTEDTGKILDFLVRSIGCPSLTPDLRKDLVLSTSGFLPSELHALVHGAVHAAILDASSAATCSRPQHIAPPAPEDRDEDESSASTVSPDPSDQRRAVKFAVERKHFLRSLARVLPSAFRSSSDAFEFLPLKSRRWLVSDSRPAEGSEPVLWGLRAIVGEVDLVHDLNEYVVRKFIDGFDSQCGVIIHGESGSGNCSQRTLGLIG